MKTKSLKRFDMTGDKANSVSGKAVPAPRCSRATLAAMNKVFLEKAEYIPVKITSPSHGQCRGMLVDISESGCQVAAPILFGEGDTVLISLVINRRPINAMAVVRRIISQGGVNQIGMQFKGLAIENREFLRAISSLALLDEDEIDRMKKFLLAARHN